MRIVYYSLKYDYKKSYTLMIVLISVGAVVLIGVIILIVCLILKKKKTEKSTDFGISMSEDLNINMNKE